MCFQHFQEKPFVCPMSSQVHCLKKTHVCGACRSIKLTSLNNLLKDLGMPNCGQLFCAEGQEAWAHKFRGPAVRYEQNVLNDRTFIKLQNSLSYYHPQYRSTTLVGHCVINGCVFVPVLIQPFQENPDHASSVWVCAKQFP